MLELADDWVIASIIHNKMPKALKGMKEVAQQVWFLFVNVSDNKR